MAKIQLPCILTLVLVQKGWSAALDVQGFGAHIEGASVDPAGQLYATHFRDTLDSSFEGNNVGRNVIGQVDLTIGSTSAYFVGEAKAVFNGMRWDYTGESVYLADVGQGKVMRLDTKTKQNTTFCENSSMLASGLPNDLALSKSGFLFLSGQDWGSVSGALWLCKPAGVGHAEAVLLEGGMGRTNGIALSPDDSILYLTEATGSPVSNASDATGQRIWKYSVAADGSISDKTEFYNFALDPATPEANDDSDGMRTDVQGNLYVTRNGGGKISVLSPTGQLLKELFLPNIAAVTNLAFGGANGTTIYAVGRCSPAGWGNGNGCVDVVSSDYSGREWSWFHSVPEPTTTVSTPANITTVITTSRASTTTITTTTESSTTTYTTTSQTSTSQTTTTIATQCMGNDSRCKGSNKVKCEKLAAQGVHCRWDTPDTSGQCIGNDSRCRDSSKWWCNKLAQQGINCRWQGDTNCKSWCTQNPSEWSNKCTWKNCRTCPPCVAQQQWVQTTRLRGNRN